MGAGDKGKLRRTFSAALTVHAVIALAVVVLAETVGLWYVNHQLDIVPERMAAANWVYQFSILASVITIFQIPFVAAIMAHEKMGYYAVVAMVNVFLKLGVALAILFCASADNLIVYAGLIFVAAAIVGAMYMVYSIRRFAECRWSLRNDGAIVKSLLRFTSCDVYGNLCITPVMTPPIVSPSFFTRSISERISAAFPASGQRTSLLSISDMSYL